jgi:transcriptional regulator with XRE-family HTH domain
MGTAVEPLRLAVGDVVAGENQRNGHRRRGQQVDPNTRYVQLLGWALGQVGLTIAELAQRSGVPQYRLSQMLNGVAPITEEDAARIAPVLKVPLAELVSGPLGVQVSGDAIFRAHDLAGRPLPGSRPLTRTEWIEAWKQLDVAGVLPTDGE